MHYWFLKGPLHYDARREIKEIKSFCIKNLVTFSNLIQKPSNLFQMVQNHKSFVPNIFFYQICQKFVDLFTKNMNDWSDKKIILYLFCSFDLLRKKVENNFFIRAAVLCANISQIFFSQFDHQKYLRCLFKSLFKWSPHFLSHPSARLLELNRAIKNVCLL